MTERKDPHVWGDQSVEPGGRINVEIEVGAFYSGALRIPVHIWRAKQPGPTVFVTAAVHGDEINGTGSIRQLLFSAPFELLRGTLILVPVVNLLGFERHSRYLPDRRDLNRSFPGSSTGSLAARFADVIFREIVCRSDYGVDLHTAAVRRTNFPNLRADISRADVADFAAGFQTELLVKNRGAVGSLRRSATENGCPTVLLEAGEVWKVESTIVEYTLRILRNGLIALGMVEGTPTPPAYETLVLDRSSWMRAQVGGFLQFHVGPGDLVEKDAPLATNTSLTGAEQNVIRADKSGVILGMTTLPSVAPGDAMAHIGYTTRGTVRRLEKVVEGLSEGSLHERLREDLSAGISVSESEEQS